MSTEETIKLVFEAFAIGLAVPLALQLFLTLRTAQRTMASTRLRMERTMDGLDVVISKFQGGSPSTQALSALGAALVPAAAAALKAWRETSSASQPDSAEPDAKKLQHTSNTENDHARS